MDAGDTGTRRGIRHLPEGIHAGLRARRKLVGKQLYTLLGVPRGDAAGMLKQFRKNYESSMPQSDMILCVEKRMGNGQWIDCGIFLDQLMRWPARKACTPARSGLQPVPARGAAANSRSPTISRDLRLRWVIADPDEIPNNLITERAPIQTSPPGSPNERCTAHHTRNCCRLLRPRRLYDCALCDPHLRRRAADRSSPRDLVRRLRGITMPLRGPSSMASWRWSTMSAPSPVTRPRSCLSCARLAYGSGHSSIRRRGCCSSCRSGSWP